MEITKIINIMCDRIEEAIEHYPDSKEMLRHKYLDKLGEIEEFLRISLDE